MNKGNKSDRCPPYGDKRTSETKLYRSHRRGGFSGVIKLRAAAADVVVGESSDDKTADDFAAALMNARKERV